METRPVLLGSNGENNDQQLEVNADDARDHIPVLNGHDHEQIAEASDPEEAPDTHDHEEILNALDPEPVPEPDDSTAIANVSEEPSTPDAHVDIPDNPSPVPGPGGHGSVEDDRPLLEERERPSGNVTSNLLPTEISSVPSISGREPVGGNDETTRYDTGKVKVDDLIFGNGNNPVPSAPTTLERGRNSADPMGETQPRVTDADGSLKESGRYPLLDDLQTDTLTRRSPAGSIFGDQEIRRPPLYTSAPSRPFSPLSYTRQDYSVISPLVSPRDSELSNESGNDRSVTRTLRLGPNGGTLHDHSGLPRTEQTSTTSLRRLMDRQSPAGSVRSYGSSPRITGNYQPAESQPWSEDKLRGNYG